MQFLLLFPCSTQLVRRARCWRDRALFVVWDTFFVEIVGERADGGPRCSGAAGVYATSIEIFGCNCCARGVSCAGAPSLA